MIVIVQVLLRANMFMAVEPVLGDPTSFMGLNDAATAELLKAMTVQNHQALRATVSY